MTNETLRGTKGSHYRRNFARSRASSLTSALIRVGVVLCEESENESYYPYVIILQINTPRYTYFVCREKGKISRTRKFVNWQRLIEFCNDLKP